MAFTKPGVKYARLESVEFCAEEDDIHITSDDPDAKDTFHMTITNNPRSKRYHPTAFRQPTEILTRFGKTVPRWGPSATEEPADRSA